MAIKIMIADDHVLFREGVKMLLESDQRFEVVGEAENGIDTFDKVVDINPDILLLDINMPQINGFDVLLKLREKEIHMKVIIITYHDEMDYLIRAINLGVNGYLLKRTDFSELKAAIIAVMNGEKYIQPSMIPELKVKTSQLDRDNEKIKNLTRREVEVLKLMAVGMYNKEIANKLDISERTVKNHISNIFKKIVVTDRTQAAVFAIKSGLITI